MEACRSTTSATPALSIAAILCPVVTGRVRDQSDRAAPSGASGYRFSSSAMMCGWMSPSFILVRRFDPLLDCSVFQGWIEPLGGAPENPVLLLRARVHQDGPRFAENACERVVGCREIRTPCDAIGAIALD